MNEKKQVLIVIQLLRRGGIELVAIRQALALDKRRFDVTLYLQNPYDEENDAELADVLAQGGVRVISRPEFVSGYVANYKYLCHFLTAHKFDVVHSHVTLLRVLYWLRQKSAVCLSALPTRMPPSGITGKPYRSKCIVRLCNN